MMVPAGQWRRRTQIELTNSKAHHAVRTGVRTYSDQTQKEWKETELLAHGYGPSRAPKKDQIWTNINPPVPDTIRSRCKFLFGP